MFIPIWGMVLIGLSLIYLIKRIFILWDRVKKSEYEVYVDTSGVASNPPSFIELANNKTINIKFDDQSIVINQISFNKGLNVINKISLYFTALNEAIKHEPKDEKEEIQFNGYKVQIYNSIVNQIYELSKHFVKNKRNYKKKLLKKAKDDTAFILNVCAEIIDYWGCVGKLVTLLSKGQTLRQTVGGGASWNSLNMDLTGKTEIKPRYALSTN
jgi:hypothetical protein